eukprot:5286497-Prymnesium_polylepis.1
MRREPRLPAWALPSRTGCRLRAGLVAGDCQPEEAEQRKMSQEHGDRDTPRVPSSRGTARLPFVCLFAELPFEALQWLPSSAPRRSGAP